MEILDGSTDMGDYSSYAAAALRWAEVCADPALRDLPFKIELNAWGKIEMSPGSTWHARQSGRVIQELARQLPDGEAMAECPIHTGIGIRVPDVAWASRAFLATHGAASPFPRAPEICIEVLSPSNTADEVREKTRAYLEAGAVEVWLVDEAGQVAYHDATGKRASSRYPVTLVLPSPQS